MSNILITNQRPCLLIPNTCLCAMNKAVKKVFIVKLAHINLNKNCSKNKLTETQDLFQIRIIQIDLLLPESQ